MILWFSGTGNSRYVAERLAGALGQSLRRLDPTLTTSPLRLPDDDRMVVWVCPVYSWGLPPYVRDIIRKLTFADDRSNDIVHHLVVTCGDDCGLTADMWRSDLSARKWTAGNVYSVTMPNNYVCMTGFDVDSKTLEAEKLAAAPARISQIASELRDFLPGTPVSDDLIRGSFAWIKTRIIYPWFVRHAMSPKHFRYTSACISCGKCAAVCPLRNVKMLPDKAADIENSGRQPRKHPKWGADCAFCLACYHVCPRHAVMYGKKTLTKGQYMNPEV
ncbi:MAG: EFR1 family ferrodoxin [Staphylococcus sp.]|nr:EFR1 family ferrodoxin [Staphylococcus sp.]